MRYEERRNFQNPPLNFFKVYILYKRINVIKAQRREDYILKSYRIQYDSIPENYILYAVYIFHI